MNTAEVIRILLIEDEPGDAGLVQISLRNSKVIRFEVDWVENLSDASTKLAECSFDVLLLDLSLPDSSGLETLQNVQKLTGEIPVIVLTGQNDTDFALTALKEGAADYLVKGDFSDDSLIRTIRHTLQRAEMESRNRLLVAALEATINGVVITDRDATIRWANPAFSKLTGYGLDEAIGRKPAELVKSGLQNQEYYQQMWDTLLAGDPWRGEIINRHKNGELYHEELSIAPVLNKAGVIKHFVGIKEDISERKRLEMELQRLADTDPLTGLFNRRVFLERLLEETGRLKRMERHSASLLMFDLDFFKQVNDSYGHAIGDKVLRRFADILVSDLRNIDIPARLGGEEFAALLPGAVEQEAITIAERLRQKVEDTCMEHPTGEVRFTVSIGVAQLSAEDKNYEDALHRADAALYQAKTQGRNQSCFYLASDESHCP